MLTEKVLLKTETVFSDDRRNRYLLRKEWDAKKPRATIIMTNPSAADLMTMDYTTLYILNNISKLDFGAVDIVNLSSRITTKLNASEDLGFDIEKENAEFILKSAEKSDKIIIAWGKIGDNNKKVRAVQNELLTILKPFKNKLFCIASSEDGDSGFHPLAPQIRFQWVLRAFTPPVLPEQTEKNKTANNKPDLNVPAQSQVKNPS